MAKKVGTYKIPFDSKTGEQLSYPQTWNPIEWVDNYKFEDEIEFSHFERGRSAAHAIFKRATGTRLTVFLKDFEEMIPLLNGGKIAGTFTYVKRGQNYGCTIAH